MSLSETLQQNQKRIVFGLLSFFLPIFLVFGGLLFFLLLLTSTSDTSKNDCIQPSINNPTDATDTPKSIEQFVKSHKDAYLLSWKAGGFLPSASISQTMVENGFNFTNPSGTSVMALVGHIPGLKTTMLELLEKQNLWHTRHCIQVLSIILTD